MASMGRKPPVRRLDDPALARMSGGGRYRSGTEEWLLPRIGLTPNAVAVTVEVGTITRVGRVDRGS